MMGLGKPHCASNLKSLAPAIAEILYENPKILGAPLAQGQPAFSFGCDFMMGIGKPKLSTKFEVASFSHRKNIKGKAPNFGELP